MKELIKDIASRKGLSALELKDEKLDPTLFYFEDKNDFYLLICSDYATLVHHLEVDDNSKNLDLAINAYLDSIKQHANVKLFGNIVDFNLSCIVAVELSSLNDLDILKKIHIIEENYKISKKYILPYSNEDFNFLEEKIGEDMSVGDITEKLNKLALKYSNAINDEKESWYRLLMNLFIKIPFLNYQTRSFGLVTISEYLDAELSSDELSLLENIHANYDQSTDIETFISQFQIDKDEQI
ncbi:hypothetical protein GCM10009120_29510 [Sphingobacterium siyangense subsp. cladoniae]|uniref:ABC-three component system middle component 1 n=1 Tax=Sphingobacterium siyangense TaxID=459529 RepID=UPI0031F95561